jgi:TRAP-type C4-dicarboxylate transport system permease small subunit
MWNGGMSVPAGGIFCHEKHEVTMRLLGKLSAIFDTLVDTLSIVAGVLLISLMLATCLGVFFRYFLGRSILGLVDISEVLLLYITFLGAAWLLRKEGYVKVELLSDRLSPRTRAWLEIIISAICAICCLVVVRSGVQLAWDFVQRGVMTPGIIGLNRAWPIAIIPLGSLLLALQLLKRALNIFENTLKNTQRN